MSEKAGDAPAVPVAVLNLWCAEGMRAVKLTEVQQLRFLNPVNKLDAQGRPVLDLTPKTPTPLLTRLVLAVDPKDWIVTLEADGKDKSGAALHFVIEAKIENLELPNRSLVGTWRSQRGRGAFEASRQ